MGRIRSFLPLQIEQIREAAVKRIKDQVDFASLVGANVIIGLIRGPLPEGEFERATARTYATDCLKECADYAQKAGVQLPIEAINRYETNFLTTAEEADRFIREIDSNEVGLHLDTFHMNIEEVSIEEASQKTRRTVDSHPSRR